MSVKSLITGFNFALFFLFFFFFSTKSSFAQCAANNCQSCNQTECNSSTNNISTYCSWQTFGGCTSLTGCTTTNCNFCDQFSCLSPCTWTSIPNINPNNGLCSSPSSPAPTPTPIPPTPTPIPLCSAANCGNCSLTDCANTQDCMVNTTKDACVPYTPPHPFQWFYNLITWIGDQWNAFWSWFFGCFVKIYTIPTNPSTQQQNFTDYGVASNEIEDTTNINAAENRETTDYQQRYFKGRYMLDVINNTIPDIPITKICTINNARDFVELKTNIGVGCTNIGIVCLANYFTKDSTHPTFVYTDQFGATLPITNFISAITTRLSNTAALDYMPCETIPKPNFDNYQKIYLNFFRIPPGYAIAVKNENATRVFRTAVPYAIQTPIPTNPDDSQMADEIEKQQSQLNKNFIPEGSSWSGLNSLRPQSQSYNNW